jgi:uncharacterized membrane protein (UPF0127 family)
MLLALSFMACEKVSLNEQTAGDNAKKSNTDATAEGTPGPSDSALATIVIGENSFTAEIASTPEEKAKGLMGRESLPEKYGMWFVFDQMGDEKFWMKNTLIPLDLLFADKDMKIVHIIKSAAPNSEELLSSPAQFQYVFEIAGGSTDKYAIKVGDSLELRIGPK